MLGYFQPGDAVRRRNMELAERYLGDGENDKEKEWNGDGREEVDEDEDEIWNEDEEDEWDEEIDEEENDG